MQPEPIKPPWYGHEVVNDHWYCLLCPQVRTEANGIHTHLKASHDVVNATRKVDYAQGIEVRAMRAHHEAWVEAREAEFHRQVNSLRGAEDFAFEVGEGLPDA